ncbi:hypothetical protein RND61_31470 [Streptomyces sp. TRM76323]|uniref:Uncharacterized protein n=1 Tax=Streptomyces tamarix TaxID=3078565 RepID=A0ABU3QUV6_9ACTN|nr:hypothetical protein [Streptomyces tamarix]MDT9686549.1 hypothetical protein [Streptomyces tamarix]
MVRADDRGRVIGLCVFLVALGSPWARELLIGLWTDDSLLSMLNRALLAPGWELSPRSDPYLGVVDLRGNVACVGLLAGAALLVPRLVGGAPPWRGVRFAAALGTGVLVSLVGSVLSWAAVITHGSHAVLVFGRDAGAVFVTFLADGLVFGVLFGLVVAVVYAGAATAPGAGGRRPSRTREGRTAMADAATGTGDLRVAVATGTEPGDATRYLCAAAYTDPAFARHVVEGVLGDRLGAIAVSPGVDLVPVARHSLTARRLRRERDRKLAAAFGLIALFGPLWLLFARLALRYLGAASAPRSKYPAVRGRHLPYPSVRRLAVTAVSLLVAGALAGAGLSALPLPGFLRWLAGGYGYGVPPLLAVVAGTVLAMRTLLDEERDVDARMRGALRRGVFDPDRLPRPAAVEPWVAARIAALADAQRGNVTCHSGFSPFVGYGRRESEWTLSLPLLPAEPSVGDVRRPPAAVADFDAWDVVGRLRRRLAETADGLPAPAGPGGGAGLVVEDRVFVSGRELAGDGRFLPDPLRAPATRLPEEAVRRIALHPDGVARHFLVSHLPLWGGEVVPSHFLHVAVVGRTLHLRCERFVLGPVRRGMHAVDLLPPAALAARSRRSLLPGALRRAGGALWGAPRSCLADLLAEYRRPRRLRSELRAAREDPAFDRGARLSIREDAQGPEYFHHSQLVDARRVLNALDRHTLAAVRDFLDEHGVDTADFRIQTQTILNHGVLQTGGVSVVGNQAVGTGAQATAGPAPARAGGPPPPGGTAER